MKKVVKITLLSIMSLLLFAGCVNPSPTKTVETFFKEIKEYKNEDLQKYIDSSNEADKLAEEYDGFEVTPEITDAMIRFFNKFDATVLDETITGDSAVVNVELNAPSFTTILKEYMSEAISKALSDAFLNLEDTKDSDELTKEFQEILINKLTEAEAEKRNISINLTKEDGKWTITPDEKLYSDIMGLPNLNGIDTSLLGI